MKAASKLMVGLMAICSAIQCSDAFSLPSTNISNFTLQGEIYQASLERFQSQHHRLGNPQDISISRNQTEIGDGKLNLTNPYEAWEIYRKTEPGEYELFSSKFPAFLRGKKFLEIILPKTAQNKC